MKSDGKASAYYDFPKGCNTLNDLIEYKDMSFAQGNIFKAAYRLGNKDGISIEYDLNKIIYYAQRMLNQLEKEKDVRTTCGCNECRGTCGADLARDVPDSSPLRGDDGGEDAWTTKYCTGWVLQDSWGTGLSGIKGGIYVRKDT
jgi:hypothetical protein